MPNNTKIRALIFQKADKQGVFADKCPYLLVYIKVFAEYCVSKVH